MKSTEKRPEMIRSNKFSEIDVLKRYNDGEEKKINIPLLDLCDFLIRTTTMIDVIYYSLSCNFPSSTNAECFNLLSV